MKKNNIELIPLVIDTRERRPFFQYGEYIDIQYIDILPIVEKLDFGDYSIRGFENELMIERKSVNDFIHSISHDRERFKRMLENCPAQRSFIVIEGNPLGTIKATHWTRTKAGGIIVYRPMSELETINMHPNAILQTIVSIMLRYNVIFYFAENRKQAEHFTYSIIKKFYNLKRKKEL